MPPAAPAGALVVVGSLNLDLVVTVERHPVPGETVPGTSYAEHPGGKGLNQAVAAARSARRGDPPVSMLGAVGADQAGSRLLEVARDAGVDTSGIGVVDGMPTGRAAITVDRHGENTIVVVAGANERLRPDHVTDLGDARVVLAQLETPIDTVVAAFRAARGTGATTILDPAPSRELPDHLWGLVDLVCPNEHELAALGGLDHLHAQGVADVLVTLGADGALLHRADGTTSRHPAPRVRPIDTTGAGDAFRGTLALRIAAGDTVIEAIPHANAAGAAATTVAGAVPSLPHRARIDELLGR